MASLLDLPTVADFLKSTQLTESCNLSLGNPAGDADSIISAICSAYIDSTFAGQATVPIASIPHEDLRTQRPETKYLLQLAGIDLDDILGIDNPNLPRKASLTLVDHNQLTVTANDGWTVTKILDHHLDEGAHLESWSGTTNRNIAFDASSSTASVASTCTLLVEDMMMVHRVESFPPSLSILLLGVILLDSINMSPKAGKGTKRDQSAIQALEAHTDWGDLSTTAQTELCFSSSYEAPSSNPDHTKLFDALQNQKFSPEFWNSLTALQGLKLDYKSFGVPRDETKRFGVSTILQSRDDFWKKEGIWDAIGKNCADLEFFGCMFSAVVDGKFERQLTLASWSKDLLDALVEFLKAEGSLDVATIGRQIDQATRLNIVHLEQGNAKASRKQVVPVLMDFFVRS